MLSLSGLAARLLASAGSLLVGHLPHNNVAVKVGDFLNNQSLYAANYGVKGDKVTDDTVALQAFFDLCKARGKTAYMGGLKCKISATVYANNIGVIWDRCSFAASGEGPTVGEEPGLFPSGSGYTAINCSGIISTFRCTVTGSGFAANNSDGSFIYDTRADVEGIQFGNAIGSGRETIIRSQIDWARCVNVRGTGIRVINAFDCKFVDTSTETCGGPNSYTAGNGNPAEGYAFTVEDGGNTTNECVFVYHQTEFAKQRAMYVSPNIVSCNFLKVHSERGVGIAGTFLWRLGNGKWSAVRIDRTNGQGDVYWEGQNLVVDTPLIEGPLCNINSTGGSALFFSASGIYQPNPASNGKVTFISGVPTLRNVTQNWTAQDTKGAIYVGACAENYYFVACRHEGSIDPADGSANYIINSGRPTITGGQLRSVKITGGAYVILGGNTQTFQFMKMSVDAGCDIVGDLNVNNVGVRMNGRVIGAYNMIGNRQTLFGETAEVTGAMPNTGVPENGAYLDGFTSGAFCKNMRPSVGQPSGWIYSTDGAWLPVSTL